jgi:hypothetical protein
MNNNKLMQVFFLSICFIISIFNMNFSIKAADFEERSDISRVKIQEYRAKNFSQLLTDLRDSGNNFKKITLCAGYSGHNGERDFDSMLKGRCRNKERRFNSLINAVLEGELKLKSRNFFKINKYSVSNFSRLLTDLREFGNNFTDITLCAGYSGHNGKRDFDSMIEGRSRNPQWRFNLLIDAISKGSLSFKSQVLKEKHDPAKEEQEINEAVHLVDKANVAEHIAIYGRLSNRDPNGAPIAAHYHAKEEQEINEAVHLVDKANVAEHIAIYGRLSNRDPNGAPIAAHYHAKEEQEINEAVHLVDKANVDEYIAIYGRLSNRDPNGAPIAAH